MNACQEWLAYWVPYRERAGVFRMGPLVLTTESRQHELDRNAFELGVDAGAAGLVKPQPLATVRHLRAVE